MVYNGPERRKYKRYDFEYPINIQSLENKSLSYQSTTINVSERGVFCKINDNKLKLFEKVKVKMLIPLKVNGNYKVEEILLEGIVIRKEIRISRETEDYYIAIYFENIPDEKGKLIIALANEDDKSIIKKLLSKATPFIF